MILALSDTYSMSPYVTILCVHPAPSPCGAEAPATACPVLRWRTSPRSSPARAAPPVNARGQRDPSTGPVLSLHPPYRGAGQEPRPDRLQGGWRGDHPASRAWGWTPAGPWAGAGARGVLATPQGIAPPAQGWGCRMHTHEGITGPGLSPEEAPLGRGSRPSRRTSG